MDITSKFSKNSERNARTVKDAKEYLSQRYELLKLELLEKSSQLISVVLSMLIVVVCALVVLVYISSAIVGWLTLAFNAAVAYSILCGVFIIIMVVVFLYKDRLFVKPLIRKLSRILYSQDANKESETIVGEDVSPEEGGDNE